MDTAQSDRQIVTLLTERDERGLAALYDRHGGLVYSLILRIVRHEVAAERLTGEVFLRAWRQSPELDPDGVRLAPWLLAIAHRVAIGEVRRGTPPPERVHDRSDRPRAMQALSGRSPADEEPVPGGMRREAVRAALAEMPPDERRFLEMAYFEGLTHQQIAERTRIPLDIIRATTCRALRHLGSSLMPGGPRSDTP